MPTVTLRPSGDGTLGSWLRVPASGTWASKIVDDPDSNDGDTSYIVSPNVADGTMWVTLDDMPGDFDSTRVTSITLKAAAQKIVSAQQTADTSAFYMQLERSDESTDISTESAVCTVTDTTQYILFSQSVSVSGSHSNTDWNGARLKLRYDHTAQMATDTVCLIHITAAEVVVGYSLPGTGYGSHPVMMGGPYF